MCGDHIWITLRMDGGSIADLAFEGESCAICKASASMMTANVKGKSVEQAERMVQEFRDMATGRLDLSTQPNQLGRLTVFAGVKDLPSRVKCAILPWHTLHATFHNEQSASTEGDADPMGLPAVKLSDE